MTLDVVTLTQDLIRCPSVTPTEAGVFDVLESVLTPLGFTVSRVVFEEEGTAPVANLYARYGTVSPNICFAGHTDVVPAGDESAWRFPPFSAHIQDGVLYGRGAEDMKGAIAAFIVAAEEVIAAGEVKGSLSLLITQDEEGIAINGTRKMLSWLKERGETLDACVVGEPTNPERLGEMIKIGRRGSISFTITVEGTQGHVAYPERADNPVTRLVAILHALQSHTLDNGTEHFPPSNLEVTSIDVGNPTVNMIPARASASANIRFNTLHTRDSIEQWIHSICAVHAPDRYSFNVRYTGDAFLTHAPALAEAMSHAAHKVTGIAPVLSTTGGTSDARFIKDVCPVIEFGTTGHTPHQCDERVVISVLQQLAQIYALFLRDVMR
jgi:succinyl-diaminopimelate desuccinylase